MIWSQLFDADYIDPEFIIKSDQLDDYYSMNKSRKDINSNKLKYLYNKNNIKKEFINTGFNTPELYLYTQNEISLTDLSKYNTYVVKPAHMSWSDHVYINSVNIDRWGNIIFNSNNTPYLWGCKTLLGIVDDINSCLHKETNRDEPLMLKQCEKGIIVEEFINNVYELKVFVLWGCPLIADLRTGSTEFSRQDFITKDNDYLNWDKEFDLIEKFAEKIKIDFFRIDFLYDGNKLYASECAFMPSTILPTWVTELIFSHWRKPYYKFYYPYLA